MFAGLGPAFGALPNGTPSLTPERELELALQGVTKAAGRHAEAVRVAAEVPGLELVPQALVDAIVAAGSELDKALGFAVRRGATAADLAATSGLHPTYVRELLAYGDSWPV